MCVVSPSRNEILRGVEGVSFRTMAPEDGKVDVTDSSVATKQREETGPYVEDVKPPSSPVVRATHRYPAPGQDWVRFIIAGGCFLLIMLLTGVAVFVWAMGLDRDIDTYNTILTPVIGLVGVVMGYYFQLNNRR